MRRPARSRHHAEHHWLHPEDRRGLVAVRRLPGFSVLDARSARATATMAEVFREKSAPLDRQHPAVEALEEARLALGHDRRPELRLLDAPYINAHAIDDSWPLIVLTRGMLEVAGPIGALPVVLGHELAHIIAGHARGRSQLAMLSDLGGLGWLVAGITGGASLTLRRRLLAWIRHGELSADRAGALAGGLEASLTLMKAVDARVDETGPQHAFADAFETHPTLVERQRALSAWHRRDGAAADAWRELSDLEAAPAEEDLDALAAAELAEFDEDDWDD